MVKSLDSNPNFGSDSDNESKLEARLTTERHHKKAMEEIQSTLRSLNTNLIVITIGMSISSATKLFPKDYQTLYINLANSFQKILYPIATTVANFGKVRSVIQLFCDIFLDKD